jgi:hypothetical protein
MTNTNENEKKIFAENAAPAAKRFDADVSLFKTMIALTNCQTDLLVLLTSFFALARSNDANAKQLLCKMTEDFIEAHQPQPQPKPEGQQ